MSRSGFLQCIGNAFSAYGGNPLLLLPALALFLALALFKEISLIILPQLQTTFANILWTLVASLLLLALVALSLSALLALVFDVANARSLSLSRMFVGIRRFSLSLFGILLVIRVAVALLLALALGTGNFVLEVLDWGNNAAFFTAVALTLAGVVGGLLFFAFAPVVCVVYNKGVWASMCTSARFVRKHYFPVLALSAILSLILFLIERFLPDLAAELVKSLVFLPLLALYLCFMLVRLGGKNS